MKRNARGFTLVEILIVVIILGILAAIVIPQFTNASSDARTSSTQSTLQTIRSQIELFKVQHGDQYPTSTALGTNFAILLTTSGQSEYNTTGTTTGGIYGPYLQQTPVNPANKNSKVTFSSAADTTSGWYYTINANGTYTLQARSADGTVLTY